MKKVDKIKSWVKSLDYREIHQLLLHLRSRNDILIPACFTKNELRHLLEKEGIADHLSDEDFIRLKKEFDRNYECCLREWVRTMVLMTIDRSKDPVQHPLSA
jgi:hypothetical protein